MKSRFVLRIGLALAVVSCVQWLCAQTVGTRSLADAPSQRAFPPSPTSKQRWDKYVNDTFTGGSIYFASFGAAIGDEASNTPKPWGRSADGYFKRVGTQYATFAIQNSIYDAGAALLHNQGDYIVCRCGSGWHRAGYALEMTFLTYHNGHKVVDTPQFVAAYGAGILPVLWFPKGYSPSAQGIQRGSAQFGLVVVDEIREFAPELKHFFGKFKP